MNDRIHHLLDEMLALEQSERSALLLALLESQEDLDSDPAAMEAWQSVAHQRLNGIDSGAEKSIPWSEVKARFLAL
jgi:Putative addiction module component